MFTIFDLIFALGYVVGLSQFLVNGRRSMMMMRLGGSAFALIYWLSTGSPVGLAACVISTIGSAVQLICPDHLLRPTRFLRLGIALLLSGAAGYLHAGSAGDLLPLIAVINARLSETQSCPQRIRMMLFISQVCWLGYGFDQGLIMIVVAEYIGIGLNMYKIWSFERKKRRFTITSVFSMPGRRIPAEAMA